MRILYFLLLCCVSGCLGCEDDPYIKDGGPLVKTASGALLGKYEMVSGTEIAAFLGIPFAEPPVNEKRFMRPKPHDGWEGVRNATEKPSPCMQYSTRNFSWIPSSTPSEDCLYLNVWVPGKCCRSNNQEKLPVIVWIYGGGFSFGSTDMDVYDGKVISSYGNAVVVSINYRVGVFGFLKSNTDEAPGNVGLLDQNLALKWIKTNIEHFGGDSQSITLMGESAGAISASLHMISPMSRNLFHRAIMQSATAYQPQMVDSAKAAFFKADVYAKGLGCISLNSIETDPKVFECIKSKSSMELLKAQAAITSIAPQYFLPFYGDEFLPISPIKAISEKQFAPVDILIGNNRDEVTIFLNYMIPTTFRLDSEPDVHLTEARIIIEYLFSTVPNVSAEKVFEHYFQNVTGEDSREVVKTIAHAFGDYVFYCPVKFLAEKASNAYMYWFTHKSAEDNSAEWLGVTHFTEIPFVFGSPIQYSESYTPEDRKFSEDLIQKWTTFASKGHPLADKNSVDWPAFQSEKPLAYELNPEHPGVLTYPRAEACEFWRSFMSPESH